MLNKFEQSIVDRLRYATHNNKPATLGADEVHIPMNAIEERDRYRSLGTVKDFQKFKAYYTLMHGSCPREKTAEYLLDHSEEAAEALAKECEGEK